MTDQRVEQPQFMTLRAVVKRADGTVVDVGQIAARYRNPVRQWLWTTFGKRAADRRIRRANRQVSSNRHS